MGYNYLKALHFCKAFLIWEKYQFLMESPQMLLKKPRQSDEVTWWEHTGSNRGPSACKADALNQLSYAPLNFRSANIGCEFNFKKLNVE